MLFNGITKNYNIIDKSFIIILVNIKKFIYKPLSIRQGITKAYKSDYKFFKAI